jgi:GNAT superfamily N-acetyltransferase
LDLDNVVVNPEFRGQAAGQAIMDWIEAKAKAENCTRIVLDAYVSNFKAHKFYYRNGFVAKGYHFVKEVE